MRPLIIPFNGIEPRVAPDAFIAATAVLIGDVEVGPRASIWHGCVLRGDTNSIRIGAETNVQDGTVMHVNHSPEGMARGAHGYAVHVGARVTIGHMALVHACTLADDCFIGMRAAVIDGAHVEGGAMVAAGALVTPNKRVKRGELWAGSPAKPMRELRPGEIAEFAWTVQHYCALAQMHRQNA
jgi:carbonic anhydrase/acetyltransferase-like protein (isoleucine patch superfamily)